MFLSKIILTPEAISEIKNIQESFVMLQKNNEQTTLRGMRLIRENCAKLFTKKIPIIFSEKVIEKMGMVLNHHPPESRQLVLLTLLLINTDTVSGNQKLLKLLYGYEVKTAFEAHLVVTNLATIKHVANAQRILAIARKYSTDLDLLQSVFEMLNKRLPEWKKKPFLYHQELLMLRSILLANDESLVEKTHEILRLMGLAAKTTETDLIDQYRKTNDAREMAQIVLTLLKIDPQNKEKYPEIFN